MTWTSPTDDATAHNFTGTYIIKYTTNWIINTDLRFELAEYKVEIPTNVPPGVLSVHVITSLLPGSTYFFAIKSLDLDKNLSDLSNSDYTFATEIKRIVFTTPQQNVKVGKYSDLIKFYLGDADTPPNQIKTASPKNIYLYSDSPDGEFCRSEDDPNLDANWWKTGFYVTVLQDQTYASFYYRDKKAGERTITADDAITGALGIIPETHKITIVPGDAKKFLVIPTDSKYQVNITEYKYLDIIAADVYDNRCTYYVGIASFTSLHPTMLLSPTTHKFTLQDEGKFKIRADNKKLAIDIPIRIDATGTEATGGLPIISTSPPILWNGLIISTQPTTEPEELPLKYIKQGAKDQPTILLTLRTRLEKSSVVEKLKFTISGDFQPGYITEAKLYKATYKEIGIRKIFSIGSFLKSSLPDITGKVEFKDLTEGIGTTTSYYLITLSIASDIPIGKKLKLEFPTDTLILQPGSVPLAENNIPLVSSEFEVIPATCAILLDVDVTPAPDKIHPGERKHFMTLTMKTDIEGSFTDFQALTLDNPQAIARPVYYNPSRDAEIINIYLDDGDGVFLHEFDFIISTGIFTFDRVVLSLSPKQKITSTPKKYFITATIPEVAEPKKLDPPKISLLLRAATPFILLDSEGLNSISPTREYQTRISTIIPIIDYIVPSPIIPAPRNIRQGKLEYFIRLELKSLSPVGGREPLVKFNEFKIELIGKTENVDKIIIFKDTVTIHTYNFYGLSYSIPGIKISEATFSPVTKISELKFTEQLITSKPETYSVYLLLNRLSHIHDKLKIKLIDIKVSDPDEVKPNSLPITSSENTIEDFPDEINLSFKNTLIHRKLKDTNLAWAYQEEPITIASLQATVFSSSTLTTLTINHPRTDPKHLKFNETVKKIQIFNDINSNAEIDQQDIMLVETETIFDSSATIQFPTPQTITHLKPQTYLIVYYLLNAPTGYMLNIDPREFLKFTVLLPYESAIVDYVDIPFSLFIKDKREPIVKMITPIIDQPKGVLYNGVISYFSNRADGISFDVEPYAIKKGTFMYLYALGTSPDKDDIYPWKETSNPQISLTNLNLKHNYTYYIITKVKNFSDDTWFESEPEVKQIKIDLTPPKKPNPPKHTLTNNTNLTTLTNSYWVYFDLTTDEESPVILYEIQERTNLSPEWKTIKSDISPDKPEIYITNRSPGIYYFYRVRAKNAAGSWSTFSEPSLSACTALPDELIKNVSNYPNPFDSRFTNTNITFTLREKANISITIYDLFGNLIKKIGPIEHDPQDSYPSKRMKGQGVKL